MNGEHRAAVVHPAVADPHTEGLDCGSRGEVVVARHPDDLCSSGRRPVQRGEQWNVVDIDRGLPAPPDVQDVTDEDPGIGLPCFDKVHERHLIRVIKRF